MKTDSKNGSELEAQVSGIFRDTFGDDISIIDSRIEAEHLGYFRFHYRYSPLGYDILLESERNLFTIQIRDDEGASAPLYGIAHFANQTSMENIRIAVHKLKEVLQKNEFCLCIRRDGKLYQKKDGKYKRVKENADIYRNGDLYVWNE